MNEENKYATIIHTVHNKRNLALVFLFFHSDAYYSNKFNKIYKHMAVYL